MGYDTKHDGMRGAIVSKKRSGSDRAAGSGGDAASDAATAHDASTPRPKASSQRSGGGGSSLLLSMDDFNGFRQIGKGKDSAVYAAYCPKLGGRGVCLKVYDKGRVSAVKARAVRREARVMRFLTEARVPHVCQYVGAFQDARQIYIVMEHCAGGDLLELLLKEGRAMPERRAARDVAAPVLTALAHLHAAGVIHRDVKLENVFVRPGRGVALGDFGLALCVHEEKPISPVGTLEYMPPEILRLPTTDLIASGKVKPDDVTPVDEKVDVWSFGVTAFELVTGRSPFEGASKDEVRANILAHRMRPLPGFLSADCVDFITRAMAPRPEDRPSALELLRHKWVARHLGPDGAARAAELRIATPPMPPSASAAATALAPANPALARAGASGKSAAVVEAGAAVPAVAIAAASAVAQNGCVSEAISTATTVGTTTATTAAASQADGDDDDDDAASSSSNTSSGDGAGPDSNVSAAAGPSTLSAAQTDGDGDDMPTAHVVPSRPPSSTAKPAAASAVTAASKGGDFIEPAGSAGGALSPPIAAAAAAAAPGGGQQQQQQEQQQRQRHKKEQQQDDQGLNQQQQKQQQKQNEEEQDLDDKSAQLKSPKRRPGLFRWIK